MKNKDILSARIMDSQAYPQSSVEELHGLQIESFLTDCECNKNQQEISVENYGNFAAYLGLLNIMNIFKLTTESTDG